MAPTDEQNLRALLEAQERRDSAPNVTSNVVGEIKSSLIFRHSWEQLLMSAPTALSSTGGNYVAAGTTRERAQLSESSGGFKYLT